MPIRRHTSTLSLLAALAITSTLPLAACRSTPAARPSDPTPEASVRRFEFARVVMGSRARVVLYAADERAAADAAGAAFGEMDRLNAILSDYDPESEAMRLCRKPGRWVRVSPELLEVLLNAREVWEASGGAFDPTIGPLSLLWREARREQRVPDAPAIAEARSRVGMHHIKIDARASRVRMNVEDMRLDFGGIGKGHAAGRALRVLAARGHPAALVDLGGDIAIGAPPPTPEGRWAITIDHDADTLGARDRPSTGIATSGARFQFVEAGGVRYSHIIDPRTGMGVTDPVEVTIIADEPWLADALASAASVLGPEGVGRLTTRYPGAEIIFSEASEAPPRGP